MSIQEKREAIEGQMKQLATEFNQLKEQIAQGQQRLQVLRDTHIKLEGKLEALNEQSEDVHEEKPLKVVN